MKRLSGFIIPFVIMLILSMLSVFNSRIARNHDDLVDVVRMELQITQPEKCNITYAGEYVKGTDALLWFIIQSPSGVMYRAAECKLFPNNCYYFKELYPPKTYSEDIVNILWKSEYIFLINNTDCHAIVYRDRSGNITSQIDIIPDDLPYIYLYNNSAARTISFEDSTGNEIH